MHQRGNLWLVNAEFARGLSLIHPACINQGTNLARKLSFQQSFFGVGQSEVREDITWAASYFSNGSFICLVFNAHVSVLRGIGCFGKPPLDQINFMLGRFASCL